MCAELAAGMERVVGVDGCSGGWVAVSLIDGRFDAAVRFDSLAELLARFEDAAFVAVDVPIGFPLGRAGAPTSRHANSWVGGRAAFSRPCLAKSLRLPTTRRQTR